MDRLRIPLSEVERAARILHNQDRVAQLLVPIDDDHWERTKERHTPRARDLFAALGFEILE